MSVMFSIILTLFITPIHITAMCLLDVYPHGGCWCLMRQALFLSLFGVCLSGLFYMCFGITRDTLNIFAFLVAISPVGRFHVWDFIAWRKCVTVKVKFLPPFTNRPMLGTGSNAGQNHIFAGYQWSDYNRSRFTESGFSSEVTLI